MQNRSHPKKLGYRSEGSINANKYSRRGRANASSAKESDTMPPSLALFLWLVLLLLLLRFDPAKDPETSAALWVPAIWLFIDGSRLPSQWLGAQVGTIVLEEGNALDRATWSALILLAHHHPCVAVFSVGRFLCAQPCPRDISFFRSVQRPLVRLPPSSPSSAGSRLGRLPHDLRRSL